MNGRILLARHGRTHWNVKGRRQGQEDIPLDAVGRAQALQLRDALALERIDVIYASPLARARDTATAVARSHDIEVRVDEDLLELDYGDLAGSARADLKVRLRRDHLTSPVPGGEMRDVWLRAERFVGRLRAEFRALPHVLVVGHKRTNRLLVGLLHGMTLEQTAAADHYRPGPGALVDLRVALAGDSLRVLPTSALASGPGDDPG